MTEIEIDCPSVIRIDEMLNCTIKTTGIPAIHQIYLGLGNGDFRLYNLSDYYPSLFIYPYNYSLPYNYSNTTVLQLSSKPKAKNPIIYLLLNTEFLFDGSLTSFELQNGDNKADTIELYVRKKHFSIFRLF